jgi:hypothetical protein
MQEADMRSALVLVVAIGVVAPLEAVRPPVTNPHARVRAMQPKVEKLLATGMDRSAAFRQLVRRIEASDVIVYIEARHDLRDGVGASMRFLATSATDRFLKIQLDARHSPNMLVALLGHELQHVVEVAEHPGVRSADDLRVFYRRTGVRTGPDSFDSEAAREMGYLVRAELLAGPGADVRFARGDQRDEALEGGSIAGTASSDAIGRH